MSTTQTMHAPLDSRSGVSRGGDSTANGTFDALDRVIADAMAGLKARQRADGQWCFDLEADATIPAEYIMLEHFLDEIDPALEERQAAICAREAEPAAGRSSTAVSATSARR
jgi:hypothetical protein